MHVRNAANPVPPVPLPGAAALEDGGLVEADALGEDDPPHAANATAAARVAPRTTMRDLLGFLPCDLMNLFMTQFLSRNLHVRCASIEPC
jgi:hypothetical protein